MSTKYYIYNQIKKANLYPSTENNLFPVENIKDDRRTKVFRTTEDSGDLVFDFGEAIEIDSFVIVDAKHREFNLSSLVFEVNNSNAWGSPQFSGVVSIDYEYGFAKIDIASPVSARYARIVFESNDEFCEIGKVFIGKRTEFSLDPTYPIASGSNNLSRISRNRLGQKFIDEIATQRQLSIDYQTMRKDEVEDLFLFYDYCSTTVPFFLSIDCENIAENSNRLSGYYYLSSLGDFEFVVGNYWNASFDLEEAM
jgi:hypothetical protein